MTESLSRRLARLSVSCVTYHSDVALLESTLKSLALACQHAHGQGYLGRVDVYLVDNSQCPEYLTAIQQLVNHLAIKFDSIVLISGHGNPGYGVGHNQALEKLCSDYHLVLNPDVVQDRDCISRALEFMQMHSDLVLLAPDATDEQGRRQYLAKRKPSFAVLCARACNYKILCAYLQHRMDSYEYRDLIPADEPVEIDLASGCYMFMRSDAFRQVGGFDPDFFMYFEDFDLSRRIRKYGRIMHHPAMHIVHYGGGASRKGW